MSTLQKLGQGSDSRGTCPVFIAYRDDDGKNHAEWLFRHLNGREAQLTTSDASGPPVVDAFLDENNPPTDDFLNYNQPNLERAQALVLVCTLGASQPRRPDLGEDWLYREIGWWLRERKICPLFIRTSSKHPYIPLEIQGKWPRPQWVELYLKGDELEAASAEERKERTEQITTRILRGIADSRSGVVYEELQRQKQLAFRLRAAVILLLVATILAGVLAVAAMVQTSRESKAREEARLAARREAEARKQAEENEKKGQVQRDAGQDERTIGSIGSTQSAPRGRTHSRLASQHAGEGPPE